MSDIRSWRDQVRLDGTGGGCWPTVVAVLTLLAILSAAPPARSQETDRAAVALQRAIRVELVDGDLQAAVALYEEIGTRFVAERAVAASALLHLGQCYEKLGRPEARDVYERVLRDYADQADVTAQAQGRLAALTQPGETADRSTMVVRRVWTGPEVDINGMPTPDGRYFAHIDFSTLDIAVRDLATGESRRLTSNQSWASRGFGQTPVVSLDGTLVAYHWFGFTGRSELHVAPVTAATDDAEPRVVFQNDEVAYLQVFAWSPDGEWILTLVLREDSTAQIALIAVRDGSMQVLKSLDWRYPSKLSLSPDGRYVAYDAPRRQDSSDRDIFILSVDGGREIPLFEHPAVDYGPVWAPEGNAIVFASDRSGNTGLWAIHVEEGTPVGAPQLVKPDMGKVVPLGFSKRRVVLLRCVGRHRGRVCRRAEPADGRAVRRADTPDRTLRGFQPRRCMVTGRTAARLRVATWPWPARRGAGSDGDRHPVARDR